KGDSSEKHKIVLSSRRHNLLKFLLILSFFAAVIAVTQPFDVTYQFVFVGLMWCLAILLRSAQNRVSLMLMIFISIIISTRYIYWRITKTVILVDFVTATCAILLLLAELYAYIVLLLSYFQVSWVLNRKPYPLPEDQSLWPSVDVFIPSYNEPLEVVKPTLLAALDIDWPEDKLNVYMLDDGSRPEFERYCRENGIGYITRKEHNHAKAGNINHALTKTSGDLVAIFDCDHIPVRAFLQMTVGWMVHDENIALVQTPHHFYSDDPFEKNLSLKGNVPAENSLFHDFIQKGNDTWNATMFCGSCAVIRRKPLEEIGGIAVETVTEDAHTSLRLNRKGYSSAFISMPLAAGLATESLADHINQRIRWARGMVQIFRIDNPLKGKGLTFAQRICFLNAMIHFLHGLPRIIFLLAPLPYLFANVYIIFASGIAILAYVLPHMVHSTMTNQQIQGNKRFYFWGVVYETILSWYITLPTLVALIAPKHGKFNVTAKGASNEKEWFDWTVSRPYIMLILLNFAGFIYGIYNIIFNPYAEVSTILINLLWVSYNLLVLGAASAVALEAKQVRTSPRVRCAIDARLELKDNESVDVVIRDFSKEGLGVELPENSQNSNLFEILNEGDCVYVNMDADSRTYRFKAHVRFASSKKLGLALELKGREQNIEYIRCTFACADRWSHSFENMTSDSLIHGIHTLIT
ncbi:MAG: UDP-forming cellulose synthase catalytic subunit, partial [Succinivibrio sp.]